MSFQQIFTKDIELTTINDRPYPPSGLIAGPFAVNQLITGTGNTAPANVLQSAPIGSYVMSGDNVLDLDMTNPGHSAIAYIPGVGIGMITDEGAIILGDKSSAPNPVAIMNNSGGPIALSAAVLNGIAGLIAGQNSVSITTGDAGPSIQDSTLSTGATGQTLCANGGGQSTWQYPTAQNILQATISGVPGVGSWQLMYGRIPFADMSGSGYSGGLTITGGTSITYDQNNWFFNVPRGTYRVTAVISINTNAYGTEQDSNGRLRLCSYVVEEGPVFTGIVPDTVDRFTSNMVLNSAALSFQMTLDLVVQLLANVNYVIFATNADSNVSEGTGAGLLVGKGTLTIQQLS